MLFSRRISEHRPTVILAVLAALSLASLATGTKASFVRDGIRTVVSVTAYPFLKALKTVENTFGYASDIVFSYSAARKDADAAHLRLNEAMAQVAQRDELLLENRRLRDMIHFARNQPRLTLESAEVIESFKGIIMIDRGSLHKVRESMCAVNADGIIGIVTQVNPLTANVVTLHNADCKIGAMIARNRVRGVIHGSTSDLSPYCSMNYIDMKDDVRVGDIVVTSPESVFPSGYRIGRVAAVHDTKSLWKSADVEPAVNPYQLDEVFVLRQALPTPEETSGVASPEDVLSAAPELPDKRSLQERYAP